MNPVIHLDDVEAFENAPKGSTRFGSRMARFAPQIGARELGGIYMQVEPGKRAFPFHNHLGNEEMFIILEGEGIYRYGEQEFPIRGGSVCSAPRGGKDTAHQIINTGGVTLKYISISTKHDPDVVEYPDSGKFGAYVLGEGRQFPDQYLRSLHRTEETLGYFDGEEL